AKQAHQATYEEETVKKQPRHASKVPATDHREHGAGVANRREFIAGALAVSGVALAGLPQPAAGQSTSPELQKIGEIVRQNDGKLRAVITVRNDNLILPGDPNYDTKDRSTMLRYLEGRDAAGNLVWPPEPTPVQPRRALPGPTLRAHVGDRVEIAC